MFSFFRRGITSKIMLGILGIGLFAIVVTGFGTDGMGGLGGAGATGGTVISADDRSISTAELTDQVNRQLQRAREQQPELDIAAFLRGGAYEEIVRQLVQQVALLAFADDQGITASKRMVDAEIVGIPAFRNLAGRFDEATFRQALAGQNISEQQLRNDIASSLITRQLLLPVASSARIPQGMALQYASLLLEQRTGSVGLIPAAAMGAGREPTDAELATFYRENQAAYTIPERRILRYAVMGPEQVAAAVKPTEAEIAAAYRANSAKYGARETRALSQVVLPDQAAARAFAQKLASGTSFDDAARQAGFSPADTALGDQTREQLARLATPAIADAAFSAAQGGTTQPLQSPLGWHVVRVDSIKRTAATPLAAARAEIEQELTKQKRNQALSDLVARVEEKLAESTFDEVARSEKLSVQETPALTAAGTIPDNPQLRSPPEFAPLLKAGFELGADDDPVVETITPNERFAILGVGRIIPAAAPPLAQIRDRVKADFSRKRASDRARAVASSIIAKINAGTAPAQAFAQAGVKLPAPQSVTARRIDIARPNQPVPPPLAMLFSLAKGKAKLLPAPNGEGWFVVHLADTKAGDARANPGLIQATRQQFQQVVGEEYAAQFTRSVEQRVEVEQDQDGLGALKRSLMGPGAGVQ